MYKFNGGKVLNVVSGVVIAAPVVIIVLALLDLAGVFGPEGLFKQEIPLFPEGTDVSVQWAFTFGIVLLLALAGVFGPMAARGIKRSLSARRR